MTQPEPTEKEWQRTITDLLDLLGWCWWHTRPAMNRRGEWRTPTTAVGLPDLVALKGDRLLAIEIKAAKGKPGPGQIEWLERFALLPCANAWLLRPSDPLEQTMEWLRDPSSAPRRHGWLSTAGSSGEPQGTPRSG